MKIIELHIGAFGSLKDFTLQFGDSLNVIYADNEGGKSTVMAFIKAMFYGTGRKGRSEMGLREKYTPWDSGAMGGSIVFEHSGSRYRLERQFRSSDSTDHITLCDLATGETAQCDKDFAAKLFGIGEASFERSLFIGVNPQFANDAEASGEFDLKLSNLAQTGDETTSLATVQKRLENAKGKLISKTGKAGPLAALKRELEDLQNKHKKSLADQESKHNKSQNIKALNGELAATQQRKARLADDIARAQDAKNADKLREYVSVSARKAELDKELILSDGKPLTPAFVNAISFGLQRLTASQTKREQAKAQAETLKQICEELAGVDSKALPQKKAEAMQKVASLESDIDAVKASIRQAEQSPAAPEKKSGITPVLFILFGVFIALGLGAWFGLGNVILLCTLSVLGVACCVTGIALSVADAARQKKAQESFERWQKENAERQSRLVALNSELNAARINLDSVLSLIESGAQEKSKRIAALKEKTAEIEAFDAKIQKESDEVLAYFARYKTLESVAFVEAELDALKAKLEESKDINIRFDMLSLDFAGMQLQEAKERLEALESGLDSEPADTTQLQAEAQVASERIAQLSQEIVRLETELKAEFSQSENPAAVNKAKLICAAAVESQDRFCAECDTALAVLDEAFREMRKGYGDVLQNKTLDIFSALTNGRYDAVSVSKSFDITVRPKGDFISRQADYLSRGALDQLYLSLRLSLAALLSDNEPLPVFLDDALSQFDDKRTLTALEFLKENSAQSLLFTCHNSIGQMAQTLGANVQKL